MSNIHELSKWLGLNTGIAADAYANAAAANAAAQEVDTVDARNVVMVVVGTTITGDLKVKLQGSETHGGVMADLNAACEVTLAAAGIATIEFKGVSLKRYVQPLVTAAAANDLYGVFVITGNHEYVPVS